MFAELIKDVRYQIRTGGFITLVIVFCVAVFFVINLIKSFYILYDRGVDQGSFHQVLQYAAMSSDPWFVLKHPWIIVSHIFIHMGLFHLIWNMVALFWFGRIVEDLIGSSHLKWIFLQGGLMGAIAFVLFAQSLPFLSGGSLAYGASACVMALLLAAATISPNYNLRLLFIGNVSIKYLALALVLLDILFATQGSNSGGRMAHLGGALWGYLYIILLRSGINPNPSTWFQFKKLRKPQKRISEKNVSKPSKPKENKADPEERLDQLLDKIKRQGIQSLSPAEKEELDQISKYSS